MSIIIIHNLRSIIYIFKVIFYLRRRPDLIVLTITNLNLILASSQQPPNPTSASNDKTVLQLLSSTSTNQLVALAQQHALTQMPQGSMHLPSSSNHATNSHNPVSLSINNLNVLPVTQIKPELGATLTSSSSSSLENSNRTPQVIGVPSSHDYLTHLQQQQQQQQHHNNSHLIHQNASLASSSTLTPQTSQPFSSSHQYSAFNPINNNSNITSSMLSTINTNTNTQSWNGIYPIPGTIATCNSNFKILFIKYLSFLFHSRATSTTISIYYAGSIDISAIYS